MGVIVGIDEVGRGCWAGPLLVVAARTKTEKTELPKGLKDSKLLSKKRREVLYEEIVLSCNLGEGWVQSEEIDKLGLARAMRLGVGRALMELGVLIDEEIIIDGLINYCPTEFENVKTVARADSLHPIVSAASIYAKVTRDRHMANLSQFYPGYKFEKHVGYGTKEHQTVLKKFGISRIHRKSFKPIKHFVV
jgi:ribonuclease HII